jgi:Flp pilus assembly pilin Flp
MFERISLMLAGLNREEGQGATEYAMVIGFLVVGLTIGLGVLGIGIDNFLDRVAAELDTLVP